MSALEVPWLVRFAAPIFVGVRDRMSLKRVANQAVPTCPWPMMATAIKLEKGDGRFMADTRAEEGKRRVGTRAAQRVRSHMALGLGTGSTVFHFLESLGSRLARGDLEGIVGVPTSRQTEEHAERLGIPLTSLEDARTLDLTVDGADEVDPALDLIKGLGGALVREKMVAQATRRFLIIVDESKVVPRLGVQSPLPVEVLQFGWASHLPFLQALGATVHRREEVQGEPFVTDNGNYVLDCRFTGGIQDSRVLDQALAGRAGIVGHGLFLGLAHEVLVGDGETVREMTRPGEPHS
jgi:ribose 5-phosphate isomerase A